MLKKLDKIIMDMYNNTKENFRLEGTRFMEKHDTILVSCADAKNRGRLRFVLNERYHLLESSNLQQTLLLLEQNLDCIAAVVMATSVFIDDEIKRVRTEQTDELLGQVPVIIITEEQTPTDLGLYFQWGASDVIPLDYDAYAMLRRIETITQLHLHRQHLEAVVQQQADRLRRANDNMVDVLSSIIEYRSMESGHHILRIRNYARILMEEVMNHCPEYQLTERQVTIIASASALHDIGKIAIPDAILTKPGPLSAEQWEIMKTHTTTGCAILDTLGSMADQEYLRYAHNICHYHHERWDGGGYPEGLAGDQIPICAQVVGLADAYEALTSKRVYKEACSFNQAMNMILQGECGAFSPKLLECFKSAAERFEALTMEYADGREPEDTLFDITLPPPGEEQENSLSRTRAKYYALVHYIGAFLVEVNLDRKLFHVVYNPYPEIAHLEGITTLHQLAAFMLDRVVVPREREKMHQLIYEVIPEFVRKNLRRSTHRFHYQTEDGEEDGLFEMTLLRIDSANRRSLALLIRRMGEKQNREAGEHDVISRALTDSTYICRNDQYFTLSRVSRGVTDLAGYAVEEIWQRFGGRLSEIIHPQDRTMVRDGFNRQLRMGTMVRLEHRILLKNGTVKWVTNKSQLFLGEDGREYLHSFLTDITQTREECALLQQRHQLYRGILGQTQTVLFNWDVIQDSMICSDSWQTTFGFQPPERQIYGWLAHNAQFHPDDTPLLLDRIGSLHSGSDHESIEVRVTIHGGRYTWYRFRIHAIRNREGNLTNIVGVIVHVDAEKQAERILKDRADRDSLTRLLNKSAGRKQIETYLGYYPNGVSCTMLIIDLDNFKQVNDRYGHLFGDAVLTKVAQEIKGQFKGQDIVCRIGGDEFMVLVRGMSDRHLLENRCRQLISSISNSLRGQHQKLALSCSVGIALSPEHGVTYYELFNHADQALYLAKARGKNGFCFYTPQESEYQEQKDSITAISNQIDSDEEPSMAEDNIIRHVFGLLYSSANFHDSVNKVITFLGSRMNVSRVYIFENTPDNRFCNNTFEWCNHGIQPEMDKLQMISYERDIPNYEDNFNEQGIFYCPDISVLPKTTYEIVAAQGIKSMLHCAIRQDGVFRGYIGFDECVEQRLWTKEEIQMLRYFSDLLSMFLLRHREQEQLRQQSDDLQTLLNNQNSCIYIIDPDTWVLKYSNERTRQLMPGAENGVPCYQCIMGRREPCPGCPALGIQRKRTDRVILQDEKFHREILAEATMIHWHGEECCLMTCRALPREKKCNG